MNRFLNIIEFACGIVLFFNSCDIFYPIKKDSYSDGYTIVTRTIVSIQNDSIMRCPILLLIDSNLCIPLDEIIRLNMMLKPVNNGYKTWFEIQFHQSEDTLDMELYIHQYDDDIFIEDFDGILLYKNELFVTKFDTLQLHRFMSLTADTLPLNSKYSGYEIYYYLHDGTSSPEYAMIKYKYFNNRFEKKYVEMNGLIINNVHDTISN